MSDLDKLNSQLLGTAGTYHVMSQLCMKGVHASCTFGNAPYVDVLASSLDGSQTVAIQTKTAWHALRTRGRGEAKRPDHYEFNLGAKLARLSREDLFFAFVDMKQENGEDAAPDVYIIPSEDVAKFCRPYVDTVKWMRFHPPVKMMEKYKNNYEPILGSIKLGGASVSVEE